MGKNKRAHETKQLFFLLRGYQLKQKQKTTGHILIIDIWNSNARLIVVLFGRIGHIDLCGMELVCLTCFYTTPYLSDLTSVCLGEAPLPKRGRRTPNETAQHRKVGQICKSASCLQDDTTVATVHILYLHPIF